MGVMPQTGEATYTYSRYSIDAMSDQLGTISSCCGTRTKLYSDTAGRPLKDASKNRNRHRPVPIPMVRPSGTLLICSPFVMLQVPWLLQTDDNCEKYGKKIIKPTLTCLRHLRKMLPNGQLPEQQVYLRNSQQRCLNFCLLYYEEMMTSPDNITKRRRRGRLTPLMQIIVLCTTYNK